MRLVIIASRLPIAAEIKNQKVVVHSSPGGVASGLQAYIEQPHKNLDYTWIGWPGVSLASANARDSLKQKLKPNNLIPVFLNQTEAQDYYDGFCNDTLWPLFHTFPSYVNIEENDWKAYEKANKRFCEVAKSIIKPGDVVWVHDYQLMLLPQMLRNVIKYHVPIGFFLHTPFPEFEVYRLLPKLWRKALIEGLLGADLVAFHTYDYRRYFIDSTERILELDVSNQQVILPDRKVRIDSLPLGIDFNKFATSHRLTSVKRATKVLKQAAAGRKIILSIDRLDYTKGIINRLQAYEQFLETEAGWHKKVQMFLIVVPSRVNVERYQQIKQMLDEMVGHINGKFGTLSWSPIVYNYGSYEFNELAALYLAADVALVTPLRDGMNLVAKEYIATRANKTGVLVLSELTGSAQELREAVLVNPNHIEDITRGLKEALTMPRAQQIKMNTQLQDRLRDYTVSRWAEDFIEELLLAGQSTGTSQKTTYLSPKNQKGLMRNYAKARRPLLLLDYDGTLVNFAPRPEDAKPTPKLLSVLRHLSKTARVVVISGRDKNSLQGWFSGVAVDLVAEHGAYIYQSNKGWQPLLHLNNQWKVKVQPVLETYSKRTPGAFIEHKDFSLVWHYRLANPELVAARVKELTFELLEIASKNDLQVMAGSKVIEISQSKINKGDAAMQIINKEVYDFVLAVGDDVTDENLFLTLSSSAHTVKVGESQTNARFRLSGVEEVIDLLTQLSKTKAPSV
jgi:trehalose 6-phosphate synthase/phosphatase